MNDHKNLAFVFSTDFEGEKNNLRTHIAFSCIPIAINDRSLKITSFIDTNRTTNCQSFKNGQRIIHILHD